MSTQTTCGLMSKVNEVQLTMPIFHAEKCYIRESARKK